MTNIYTLRPGIACLVYVTKNAVCGGSPVPAIWLSAEKGVVVGRHEKPMDEYGWPLEVQQALTQHFATVFALEHEAWTAKTPSPRALYVDALKPWYIQIEEEEEEQ